jgi:ABC-type transport system involved in multi-copper enzyme maturation permease subunit
MIQLIAAEVHKTLRRPFDVVLTLVVVGLSILAPVIVMVRAFRDADRAALHVVQLTWPLSVDRASLVSMLVGLLGAAMLAASAVGNEHDARTWATLVSRRPSRYPLLLAKVVVVFATVAVVSLLAVIIVVATAWIAAGIVGVAPDPIALARQPQTSPALTVVFAIADAWWSALWAIVAAVFLRSTLAAALMGILMPRLLVVVASEETAFLNPALHFMNLRHATGISRVPPLYDVGVGAWGSAVAILLFAVALTAAIAYWFEKRDVPVS